MVRNVTLPCPWLHTGPPSCEATYADGLGVDAYRATLVVYIVATAVVVFCVGWRTLEIVVNAQFRDKPERKRLFFCCWVVSLTLIVRSVDPFAWRRALPATVVWLCYDVATSAIYSILLFIALTSSRAQVRNWLFVSIFYFSQSARIVWFVKRLFYGLHAFAWINFCVLSVLQTNASPQWLYHALKLFNGAIILVVIICLQTYFGLNMYRTLRPTALDAASPSPVASSSASPASAASLVAIHLSVPAAHGAAEERAGRLQRGETRGALDRLEPPYPEARGRAATATSVGRTRREVRDDQDRLRQTHHRHAGGEIGHSRSNSMVRATELVAAPPDLEKRRTSTSSGTRRGGAADDVARRILRFQGWALLAEGLSCLFQVLFAVGAVNNQYTRDRNPPPPPEGTGDILAEAVFDVIQGFGACVIVYYFGLKGHERKVGVHACFACPHRHRHVEQRTQNAHPAPAPETMVVVTHADCGDGVSSPLAQQQQQQRQQRSSSQHRGETVMGEI